MRPAQRIRLIRIRTGNAETKTRIASRDLFFAINRRKEQAQANVTRLHERLQAVNPAGVLERGYALVMTQEGRILSRKSQTEQIREMKIRFADGEIEVAHHG